MGIPEQDKSSAETPPHAYHPQFQYTQSLLTRFQQSAQYPPSEYENLLRNIDGFLQKAATAENLIAVALVAAPSGQGLTSYIVRDGGLVFNAVTYWNLPSQVSAWDAKDKDPVVQEFDDLWERHPLSKVFGQHLLTTAFHLTASVEEFPSIDTFTEALANPEVRRTKFTLSDANCESWGYTTATALREEIKIQKSSRQVVSS